jgi:hypothetical protein
LSAPQPFAELCDKIDAIISSGHYRSTNTSPQSKRIKQAFRLSIYQDRTAFLLLLFFGQTKKSNAATAKDVGVFRSGRVVY